MKPDQLSKTAAFIAVKFYGLTQYPHYRSLFDESVITFYDNLVKELPPPLSYYHYWLKSGSIRKLYSWSEELLLPGDLLHIIARKWYIRKLINDLTKENYNQIIVLGAGFDDLSFHLCQKGFACFEFDAPYMAQFKRHFLSEQYPQKKYPHIVDLYLPPNQPELQITRHPDIDVHKKTIVIAEGFFDYLPVKTVSRILQEIRTSFEESPALISTHFALSELSPFHRKIFKAGVKTVGENLRLNISMKDYKLLLAQQNYTIRQLFTDKKMTMQLRKKISTRLSVLKGFYLLQAN